VPQRKEIRVSLCKNAEDKGASTEKAKQGGKRANISVSESTLCLHSEKEHVPHFLYRSTRALVKLSISAAPKGVTIHIPINWQAPHPRRSSALQQFGIGWGAQASLSVRQDQTRRARGLGLILVDRLLCQSRPDLS